METIKRIYQDDGVTFFIDGAQTLTMCERMEDGRVVIALSGALPSALVHDLYDELVALSTVGKEIVLDLREITYVSNACQQALLKAQQQMDAMERGSMVIVHLPEDILAQFEKIGLTELLMIE